MDKEFVKRLKGLIKKAGYENNIKGLSADILTETGGNVSFQAISYFVNGDRLPRFDTMKILCRYFKVSADYLIGLSSTQSAKINIQTTAKTIGVTDDRTIEKLQSIFAVHETDAPLLEQVIQSDEFSELVYGWLDYICDRRYSHTVVKINENIKQKKGENAQIKGMKEPDYTYMDLALLKIQRKAWAAVECLDYDRLAAEEYYHGK